MRLAGRISGWIDDKGYGFVLPHDGGSRAFVHINSFPSGSRRPVDGDLISYAVSRDQRGRTNAVDVRYAGQRREDRKPTMPLPRLAIGALFLLAVLLGALLGLVPAPIAAGYVLLSGLSFLLYRLDKSAAGKGARRISESTLHAVDLFGGWPGGLMAQQRFRHKTVKASFQWAFWLTAVVNVVALGWLVSSGGVRTLATLLSGG